MTTNPAETGSGSEAPSIRALLEQRATLEGWLARLDAPVEGASPRVIERVRADYQQRLRLTLDALGEHLGALRAQRAEVAETLAEAEFRAEQAEEELEEARLRQYIGELGEFDWEERRPALEDAVAHAGERREVARAELLRLDEILDQVEGGLARQATADGVDPAQAGIEEERFEAPARAADDEVETVRFERPADADADDADGPARVGSLSFLDAIDRAISAEPQPAPGTKIGMKCPECGYTNDADARYCGVCGDDLA